MKKVFLILPTVLMMISSLSFASTNEDQSALILQKTLEGALAQPVQNYIKTQINSVFYIKPPSIDAPYNAGAVVFAAYSFGNATYDYIHADSDKQRLYAGTQAAGAVLSVTVPPACVIVNLAIMGAQISESILGSAISERIYQYQISAQRDLTIVANINNSFAEADRAALATVNALYFKKRTEVEKILSDLKTNNCMIASGPQNLDQYELCVTRITENIGALQSMVQLLSEFLNMPMLALNKEKFFADKNIDLNAYVNQIITLSTRLDDARRESDHLLKAYSTALFEYTVKKAQAEGLLQFKETFFDSCNKSALNLIRKGAVISYFDSNIPANISPLLGSLSKVSYLQDVQNFKDAQPCRDEADSENKLYLNLIKNLDLLDQVVATVQSK